MSSTTLNHLAWIIPVGMLVLGFLLLLFGLLVDGARRDRYQAAIYKAEAARRAMERALKPDPELRRHLQKWS